jgi:dTDP-glucose pyrophosphorylase
MLISEGNLFELRDIFHKIKETSIERDEYEITEIISQIIEALEELNLEL